MSRYLALDQPAWLLVLVPLAALALHAQRTSYCVVAPARARAALALRMLAWILVALAASGARWVREHDEVALAIAIDRSASMGQDGARTADEHAAAALARMGERDRACTIGFAGAAYVERALSGPGGPVPRPSLLEGARDGTDVALALQVATATLPATARRRVLLLTDGNANAGDASTAALALRAQAIELVVIPVAPAVTGEALIERMDAPAQVRPDEPFTLAVRVRSYAEGPATIDLFKDDVLVRTVDVRLRPGVQTVELTETLPADALARWEAVLRPPATDRYAANNRAHAFTRVRDRSRVLVVDGGRTNGGDGGPAQHLVHALREAGLEVEVTDGLPATREALERADAIVLADLPCPRGERLQADLRDYVRHSGGGLVMIGGPDSYALGGYAGTPIEDTLPVSMDVRQTRYVASLAIAIAIDSSGSMHATVDGKTKLALACEGAVATLELLRASDDLGVYLVDTTPSTLLPLGKVGGEREQLRRSLRAAKPGGGGIYAKTALVHAYGELLKRVAMVKHVVLFADGADTEEQTDCAELVKRHRDRHGITLSTISLGEGNDTPFLKEMAKLGGGEFYLVEHAGTLPRVFAKDTMLVSRSALVEDDVVPYRVGPAATLEGIDWTTCPPLKGYNLATLKPRAELLLAARRVVTAPDKTTTVETDPILARWHHGLGKAAAFTSDASARWAARWIGWDGYKPFWIQTVRWAMRAPEHETFARSMTIEHGRATVEIDARDASGQLHGGLSLEVRVRGEHGTPKSYTLDEVGPGRYRARFPATDSGTLATVVRHTTDGAERLVGVLTAAAPTADEQRRLGVDTAALAEWVRLAGGRLATSVDGLFAREGDAPREERAIWMELLACALVLLAIDLVVRRFHLPTAAEAWTRATWERLALATAAARRAPPAAPAPVAAPLAPADHAAPEALVAALAPHDTEADDRMSRGLAAARERARARATSEIDEA